MKVSIITVTLNSARYIEANMNSVLSQKYDNFNHIIIDGGSRDETVSIIERYESLYNGKMKWISEKDEGIYDAMNKGIQLADGDIISILNSDDEYFNEKVLESIVKYFEFFKADIIYSDVYYFREIKERVVRRWHGRKGNIMLGWIPCHPGVFLKRNIFLSKGYFDTKFKIAADYDFLLRIFRDAQIKKRYYPACTVKMRLGGASTKNLNNIIRGNIEVLRILKKNSVPFPLITLLFRQIRRPFQFWNIK